MKIILNDGYSVEIKLRSTTVVDTLLKMYKHLQHVDVPFRHWDNPYHYFEFTRQELVQQLIHYAHLVGISVDPLQCKAPCQKYLNQLHALYEKGYDGSPAWLDFHEHIHILEKYQQLPMIMNIDYREKSGLLEKSVDSTWFIDGTTLIHPGDVFISWAELGKTPYRYWVDNEPDDLVNMLTLIKPWSKLKPKLNVSFESIDRLAGIDRHNFETWWTQYKHEWCRHWSLQDWTLTDMYSVIKIGSVTDISELSTRLRKGICPVRVRLS